MSHPAPQTSPRAALLLRACALFACLFSGAPILAAQGARKPTVEDDTPPPTTSSAKTQAETDQQSATSQQPAPESDANAPRQNGVTRAVRQRRVNAAPQQQAEDATATEASRPASSQRDAESLDAPATRNGLAASGEATATNGSTSAVTVEKREAAGSPAKVSSASSLAAMSGAEAELEGLRAQALAAGSDAERSRLQRLLAARLAELGRAPDAITVLRSLMREDRIDPVGLLHVGNALARLDDSQAAAEAYRKAVAQKNGNYSRALNNLGVVLLRLARWDEAADALTTALRLENNNYPEASSNLARLHALRGENQQAGGERLRALALDLTADENRTPANAMTAARTSLKSAAAKVEAPPPRRANAPETGETRKSTLKLDPQSFGLLQRARAERTAGRDEQAVALYRRVLAQQGDYFPPANLELGYALVTLKRPEEAANAFAPVAAKEGARYPEALYHLGRIHESTGQFDLAAQFFTRAVAAYGGAEPQVLLDVSRVREKEGNLRAAVAAMEDFMHAVERKTPGGTPDWARTRLATLRQKLNAPGNNATAAATGK